MISKLAGGFFQKANLGRRLASFSDYYIRQSSSGPTPPAMLGRRLESFSDYRIRGYSSGPITTSILKAEEQSGYSKARNLVFWDTENCGIPKQVNPDAIYGNIKSALEKVKLCGPLSIDAVGNPSLLPSHDLESSGIRLTSVISGGEQASDDIIMSKMCASVNGNPEAANILLISGDGDYRSVLENLKKKGHTILWAQISESAKMDISPIAKLVWEWRSLAGGGKPLTPKAVSELIERKKRPTNYGKSSVHDHVSVILRALAVLKKEEVLPIKQNISNCIQDRDGRYRNINVQRALDDALESQVITNDIAKGTEVFVPYGELMWECNHPIYKKKVVKKDTGLGLSVKKDENFEAWYSEVCKQDMIEYNDISGYYFLKPWGMEIWKIMQNFYDAEIKKMNVENCYFPLFVSPGVLEKEKDHIEGFAPEVAWVTKSGKSDLEVPIAIRPTTESVVYPYFSKWIRGQRDLPLKLNQGCNVGRWELNNPTPFIGSLEFLWQEGHTAFTTKAEADEAVLQTLELCCRLFEEYLAVPVLKGMKSDEKFAGGLYTTSVEAFDPHTGRGVQGATSNFFGQVKIIEFNDENENGEPTMVWQNSWGYSTRTIEVMIMTHGDDKGLILPPKVAPVQVVVIPIPCKNTNTNRLYDACTATVSSLCEAGIRAEEDSRDKNSLGSKFSKWEMKGVPLRIEIGPRDLKNDQLLYVLLVHAFYGAWCSSVGGSLHCEYSSLASLHRPHSVSITEFGAVGDGVTLNTKAFQNALFYLNSFSDKGGAKLFVPAGQWLTGSFDLISHLTLWLDKGATILGSTSSDTEIRLAAGYFPDGGEELDRSKAVANGVAKSKAHYETAA